MAAHSSKKAVYAALAGNLLIAMTKFLAGARQSTWRKAESTRENGVASNDIVDAVREARETHEEVGGGVDSDRPTAKLAKP